MDLRVRVLGVGRGLWEEMGEVQILALSLINHINPGVFYSLNHFVR